MLRDFRPGQYLVADDWFAWVCEKSFLAEEYAEAAAGLCPKTINTLLEVRNHWKTYLYHGSLP